MTLTLVLLLLKNSESNGNEGGVESSRARQTLALTSESLEGLRLGHIIAVSFVLFLSNGSNFIM